MKRLFVVTHKDGWMDTDSFSDGWYEKKSDAKKHRDRLNEGLNPPLYKVSLGPEHRRAQK